MFPYNTKNGLGDPLHPTSSYSDLQGCAAAHLISMATARLKAAVPAAARGGGPASRRGSSGAGGLHARGAGGGGGHRASAVSKPSEPWCLRAGDDDFTRAIIFNDGWEVKTGGAGGNKRWLHATQLGAAVTLQLPITTPRLSIEYYKHDDLPLGLVMAELQWNANRTEWPHSKVLLDGRCAVSDACPRGQGFYHRTLLHDGAFWAKTVELRLTTIPRAGDKSANGSEFSVVTVVAEV